MDVHNQTIFKDLCVTLIEMYIHDIAVNKRKKVYMLYFYSD